MTKIEAQKLFNKASKSMQDKNWTEAKNIFQDIKDNGFVSADMSANFARIYMQSNFHGPAIYHMNQAVLVNRFDREYRDDLSFLQNRVEQNQGQSMSHPSETAFLLYTYARPIEVASFGTCFLLAALWIRFTKKSSNLFWASLLTCVVLLGLSFFLTSAHSIAVAKRETKLYSSPLKSSESLLKIDSGARMRIRRDSGEFYDVEHPGIFRGWIKKEDLYHLTKK